MEGPNRSGTGGGGYGTPIVMVKKPKGDGKGGVAWRMACDFRLINTLSTKINYPLPNPIEALNALGKATWFSALDQSSAFHQIPIAEKDKIKTTVSRYIATTTTLSLHGNLLSLSSTTSYKSNT